MANEYMTADRGVLLWKPEGTPYTAEVTIDNHLGGIVREEIEWPHPNELENLSSQGNDRRPFVAAGKDNEYPVSIPVELIDARAPFECAIGQRKKYNLKIGHQTISNSEKPFTGAETIANGTYHLNVVDDGNPVNDVAVVCAADTITTMLVKFQAAMRIATGGLETAEVEYGMIKIASGTTGATSSILITEGAGDDGGLIAALSAIDGVTASIDDARDGIATTSWEYIFDDENILGTATLYRGQKDLGIEQIYAGCKASLNISSSVGNPIKAVFDFLGTHYDFNTAVVGFQEPSTALSSLEPYRQSMISDSQINAAGGGVVKDLVAIQGFDFKWDNGLKIEHSRGHVRDAAWGREGYVIVEEANADRYDMSLEVIITDTTELEEAYNNDTLFDIYIKAERTPADDTETIEIWLYSVKFASVPVPMPASGALKATLKVHPLDTRIRMVTASEITV